MTTGARGRRVRMLFVAVVSATALATVIALRLLVPPSLAPRINVRWSPQVTDVVRGDRERAFHLASSEHLEGTTWSYDLTDPSPGNVTALIRDAAVEDTFHVDRVRGIVAEDAPRGRSPLATTGLAAWRDSLLLEWVAIVAGCALFGAGIWWFAEKAESLTGSPQP